MSSLKHTPLGSRRNTQTSITSKDDFINLYNNPFNPSPSVLLTNQKELRSNTPTQKLFSDTKARSKSPAAVKTFKEIRNVSPNRASQEYVTLGTSVHNREKIDLNASVIMNKGFSKCGDFKDVLKKIFGFYASFGDRINRDSLKANNLLKFVHDAGILDKSNINQNAISILFCKHSLKANTIDFEKFLLIVIDIASLKYPDLSQKDAFFQLFTETLKPLYLSLYTETNLGERDIIFQEPLEPDTLAIIAEIAPVLAKLYKFVFSTEYQNPDFKTTKAKSEFLLPSFFKEFELSPFIINLNLGHALYREVLEIDNAYLKQCFTIPNVLEKDQGKAFTLRRFLLYLVRVSIIGFSSPWCQDQTQGDHEDFTQQDKLVLLLEKMEVSPGFLRFRKHVATTTTANVSLLPSKTTMKRLLIKRKLRTESNMRTNEDINIGQTVPTMSHFNESQATQPDNDPVLRELYITNEILSHRRINTRSTSPIRQAQTVDLLSSTAHVFENNKDLLQEVFKTYCSYLNSKSDYMMKVMSLVNLFRNACLLKNTQDHARVSSMGDVDADNDNAFLDKNRLLTQMQLELYIKKLMSSANSGPSAMRASRVHTNKSFDIYLPTEEGEDGELNSSRHKGVNYEVFMKVVEYVALYTYPDVDEETAVKCVINQHLQKVLNEGKLMTLGSDVKGQLKQLMEILKEPMLMDIIAMIKRKLQPFYKEYCTPKEDYVEFEGFMNFYRFYGIFPQLISRMRLVQLFHNLSALFPLLGQKKDNHKANARGSVKKENTDNKKGIIDENLFIESIVVCALETDENPQKPTLNKILFLMGRMKENLDNVILKKKGSPFIVLELTKKQKALLDILIYIQSKGAEVPPVRNKTPSKGVKKFEDLF